MYKYNFFISFKLNNERSLFCRKDVLNQTLDISDGIGNNTFFLNSPSKIFLYWPWILTINYLLSGLPSWRLALCLFGAWVIIFLIISRGVKSSGKCSYFLALFPYVIMLALLVRAVTLEGSSKGILFFLTPQWHELSNPKVNHIFT